MPTGETLFNIVFNAGLIGPALFFAHRTVKKVLQLPGSRSRKVVMAVVLFATVLTWLSSFVFGAFDDFNLPLITIETNLKIMQVSLLLIFLLLYLYVTRPPE